MRRLLFALLFLGIAQPVYSQFYPVRYRPPNLNWQQLETPHFTIVFPKGEDSVAYRTGRILEYEYSETRELVGGKLQHFPVVLNNYNDRSNGFVSPFNFRSEIEIPAIKGKSMNPRSGNWLEAVVPHELVHALHFTHLKGLWANVIGVFSPDAARSIHGSVPLGVHEGIATYHETAGVAPGGGRGNYPYFYNQFNAVFSGPSRWSLGQMLSYPSYSRPFGRHYIGGYEFTAWLHENFGREVTSETIDFYIRWPFLGYGFALRQTTGKWAGQLYDQFEKDREMMTRASSSYQYEPLPIPHRGRELRRPLWLDEDRLLIFGQFYNARPGFYIYDLDTGSFRRIIETRTVQDYVFDLSTDSSRVLFSNYRSSALYNNTYKMELFEGDLSNGSVQKLSSGLRAHAPAFSGNRILALQTHHDSNVLIGVSAASQKEPTLVTGIDTLAAISNTEFVNLRQNPTDPNQLAVVAQRRGLQGLWFADIKSLTTDLKGNPDISFADGAVFDPAWHPSGKRIVFTADYSGTMQIYEYDLESRQLQQITNSTFNAMEASYSPDGNSVAFIMQQQNERLPVVLNRDDFYKRTLTKETWAPNQEKKSILTRPELGSNLDLETSDWEATAYRPGLNWLKPRMIIPSFEEVTSDTYQLGLAFHSTDLLQRNSYELELTTVQRLPWFDFNYRHSGFFPGFEFNFFNDPSFPSLSVELPNEAEYQTTLLRQNMGFSAGLPFRFILESNSRFSSAGFTPSLKVRGTRFYELDHNGNPASDYASFLTGNFYTFLNYKLQQNIRDLQPNAGLAFYSELEHYFNSGSAVIEIDNPDTGPMTTQASFLSPTALRSGLFLFTSPFRKWNQSLRIGLEGVTQTGRVFDNQSLVSDGFSEPVFPFARHMMSLSTRYTVPLFYPDTGGFLLPFYLSNIYLVGFSNTVANMGNSNIHEFFSASRSVYGLGIRTRFRVSNFTLDLGVAIGFEPTRNKRNFFIGNF